MLKRFLPKENVFFEFFERQIALTIQGAEEFLELVTKADNIQERVERIKEIEHQSDNVTHECYSALRKTFITPFDRTEIIAMIKKLDDIMDATDSAAERILIYEVTEFLPEMKEIAVLLVKAAIELQQALKMLNKPKKRDTVLNSCIIIHKLENSGDDVLRKGLARLFKEEKDPINLIKYKEILQDLECATDFAEEVANLIEGVILEED
ncbi:MAG: DUF47 family protein [Proteobacteria bacterium]|nr:DUF47 family protein [Pseudomonadota bacterium]MBU4011020.1 DUF47 family protein [Pseudomonadota bacterium]